MVLVGRVRKVGVVHLDGLDFEAGSATVVKSSWDGHGGFRGMGAEH